MTRDADDNDRVRLAVSTAEALLHSASREFDDLLIPNADPETRRQIERIAALLGAAGTAAAQALEEIDRSGAPPEGVQRH